MRYAQAFSGQLLDQRREHALDFHPWRKSSRLAKNLEGQ
jgi:hypothetical protein